MSRCRATAPRFPFSTMPRVFPLVYSNICNLASASLVSSSMLCESRRRCHCRASAIGPKIKSFNPATAEQFHPSPAWLNPSCSSSRPFSPGFGESSYALPVAKGIFVWRGKWGGIRDPFSIRTMNTRDKRGD